MSTPILYFDGVCGLCNGFVDFLMSRDPQGHLRFATLQGKTAASRLPQELTKELNTFVFQDEKGLSLFSTAVLRALAKLGGVWRLSLLLLVIPRFIRDPIYLWIAKNRYAWFGKRNACRIPSMNERSRFLD